MPFAQEIRNYITAHSAEAEALLLRLARIPAPTGEESARAAFCRDWLAQHGAENVHIDAVGNCLWELNCEGNDPVAVFAAHSDVVFPDREALPLRVEEEKIFCPGIGDNSANIAALLMAARFAAERGLRPKRGGVVFAVNAGEEGLGNLRGTRAIMEKYAGRVEEFVSFDDGTVRVIDRCVGSRRYRVTARTAGGHSFTAFGNKNAIAALSALICDLYAQPIPEWMGKITFNVGEIRGGTSVNAIAQHAEMLYEIRAEAREAMDEMEKRFFAALDARSAPDAVLTAELLGERPCGSAEETRQRALAEAAARALERHYGECRGFTVGSTDCNIPLSLGVPAVCLGCVICGGTHTREEWARRDSLAPGLGVALEMVLRRF